ncbi:MAG: 3-oxoacyl-[acyl-carrier-protein] reductase FabG [Verrucomicrobiota bacterium]|jgi:NAD(P)-dependent dehydrogenase (short-subunit alcohol dehydrogenase family)
MTPINDTPVWLITGCSSGLGRALATRALARGHRLIATARDPETLVELVAMAPDRCRALALDVADARQVVSVVAQAGQAFGRLDVVVNNAGYGLIGAVEECDEAQIARNFETNFFGAMRVIRAALPILRAQRRGHFVNISAAAVIANYPGFSIYGATKWALEGFSESLAAEVRPLGLKVTIVQPGPFRTDFIARSLERATGQIADYDPSSGKFRRFLETMAGRQPGDPMKAADAIIAAVALENPPLRLVLGKYAIDKTRRKLAAAARELEAGYAAGLATDFAADGEADSTR